MKTAIIILTFLPQLVLAQIESLKGYTEMLYLDELTYYEPKGTLPYIDLDGAIAEGYQYVFRHWDFKEEHYEAVMRECQEFLWTSNASIASPGYDGNTVSDFYDYDKVITEVVQLGKKIEMKWYLNIDGKNTLVLLVAGVNGALEDPSICFTVCQFDTNINNNELYNDITQYKP